MRKKLKAFTIVELLLVIVTIAILTAIVVVSYGSINSKAVAASLQADLTNNTKRLRLYHAQYNSFPLTLDANSCPSTPTASTDTAHCLQYSKNNIKLSYSGTATTFSLVEQNGSLAYIINDSNYPTPTAVAYANIVSSGLAMSVDAGNVVSYPGSGTTWYDLSGNGNNCILTNGPTYSASNSGIMNFDGVNDYANCGTATSVQVNQALTLGAWVKTAVSGKWIMGRWSDYLSYDQAYLMYINVTNNLGMALDNNYSYWTMNDWLVGSTGTVNDNNWHYTVITWDKVGGTNNAKIYLDTVQVGQATSPADPLNTVAQTELGIGGSPKSSGFHSGSISVAHLYNRALSQAEITQNFNALKGRYGL